MIDLLRAKLRCTPMGAGLRFGGDSESNSSTTYRTDTTDNRQVGGDGGINVGAGGSFVGTDGGSVQLGRFNAELAASVVNAQSDATKFFMKSGTDVLNNLGGSVTDVLARSGANSVQAWTHTLDASENLLMNLTQGARANADASQVVALAALESNKSDGATASDIFKYGAIAAAVIGAAWAFKRG